MLILFISMATTGGGIIVPVLDAVVLCHCRSQPIAASLAFQHVLILSTSQRVTPTASHNLVALFWQNTLSQITRITYQGARFLLPRDNFEELRMLMPPAAAPQETEQLTRSAKTSDVTMTPYLVPRQCRAREILRARPRTLALGVPPLTAPTPTRHRSLITNSYVYR